MSLFGLLLLAAAGYAVVSSLNQKEYAIKEINLDSDIGRTVQRIVGKSNIKVFIPRDKDISSYDFRGDLYFHGTTFSSGENVFRTGVDINRSSSFNAFGRGFYATKDLRKALQYGNSAVILKLSRNARIASYYPNSSNYPLPPPIAGDNSFIEKLKNRGFDGIEVNRGVQVKNWRRTNETVREHEICVWDINNIQVLALVKL
ncbi:MAG: hypothetical protein ACTSSG_09920 [Candidatus Heimdallarchaeaceae archaeon]